MRYVLLGCILGISSVVFGQGRWGIGVNQNTDIFNITKRDRQHSVDEQQVNFGRFSAEVNYTNKKLTHELEIFIPEIKVSTDHIKFPWPHTINTDSSFVNSASSYSFRYAIVRDMFSLTERFHVAFGFGLNPYYLKNESTPRIENAYYASRTVLGASVNLIPSVSFRVSENLSVTLDCPFKVLDFFSRTTNIKNPAIPIRQQEVQEFETDFFMQSYTVRAGLVYRI